MLIDRVTTTIPDTIPPGPYALWIGFYTGWAPSWRNLEVFAAPAGLQDAGGRIALAALNVE